jgi:Family of unknown function (DUF6455)
MNVSLFQFIAAIFMSGVAIGLIVLFRKYMAAASDRRLASMLQRVGVNPATASSGDNEAIVKEIRQRCRSCASEDLCERWLAGDEAGENIFCPNVTVFDQLKRNTGAVG